jgi:hypothetical protein
MIEPKEEEIDGKVYILSKFPAIAGREIIAKYPTSILPKIGDYQVSEEIMLKLMSYVAIPIKDSKPLQLSTKALVDNHVKDWETLLKIEALMMEYNCSFFRDGRISTFFQDVAQNIPAWISKTLIALSEQLSQKVKPLSTN